MAEELFKGPTGFGPFIRSALSAGSRETIGLPPSEEIDMYRINNPIGSAISQIGGFLVPALGVTGMISKIPTFARALAAVGSESRIAAAPFMARAQVEALRFAPFELGRTAVAAAFGENALEVGTDALINLGAAGGIGGVIGKVRSAARPPLEPPIAGQTVDPRDIRKISDLVPDFDMSAAPQNKISALKSALIANPENADLYGRSIRRLMEDSFAETAKRGKYVGSIKSNDDATRMVDRLFRTEEGQGKNFSIRNLLVGHMGFNDDVARGKFFKDAQLGDMAELAEKSMYQRVLTANTRKGARDLEGIYRAGIWNRADGWAYAREEGANDMMVMMKKVVDGEKTGIGDKYLLFKTNAPESFAKSVKMGADAMKAVYNRLWQVVPDAELDKVFGGNYYWSLARQFEDVAGAKQATRKFAQLKKGDEQGTLMKMAKELGEKNFAQRIRSPITDELGRLGRIVKEGLVPTEFNLTNPRARGIYGLANHLRQAATARAHLTFYGSTNKLTTPFKYVANVPPRGGLDAAMETMRGDKKAINDFIIMQALDMGPAEAEAMGMTKKAVDVYRKVTDATSKLHPEIDEAYKIAGKEGGFKVGRDHLNLSGTLYGEHRAEVLGEGGRRYGLFGGRTPQEAKSVASQVVKEANAKGLNLRVGGEWTRVDMHHDLQEAARVIRDKRVQEIMDTSKTNVLGKAWDPRRGADAAGVREVTLNELKTQVLRYVEDANKLQGELVFGQRMMDDGLRLTAENPKMASYLSGKLNLLWGKAGPATQVINRLADSKLAQYIGGQSATKIAQAVNTGMFHLSFGFGNVSFAVLSGLTMTLTGPAEIAMLQKGSPERLHRLYTMLPLLGKDGKPRGSTGVLDVFRLMREGFVSMGRPLGEDMELIHRASREGVTDPRFAEEYVGANSRFATNIRGVLRGEQGLVNMVGNVSTLMPTVSEKFARIWSFNTGLIIGRQVFGLKEPEQLYQFAKRFNERTMYNYGSSDRANWMTGPIGSIFGLYKNWMMHYLGSLAMYAGEGLSGNFRPLLWATASAWTTGGVLGMGPASWMVDGAARVFSDKPAVEAIYEWFGGKGVAADTAMYGLPGLFGASLISSGAAPASDVMKDIGFLTNFALYDRVKAAIRGMGNTYDAFLAGQDVNQQIIRDNFVRAAMPRTVYRALGAFEDANIRSMATGNPLIKDVSFVKRAMYTIGLNPVEVENTLALSQELWRDQKALKNRVSWLGRRWNEAESVGDWDEMNRVMGVGTGLGIFDRVLRSAKSRAARKERGVIESASTDDDVGERREALGIGID